MQCWRTVMQQMSKKIEQHLTNTIFFFFFCHSFFLFPKQDSEHTWLCDQKSDFDILVTSCLAIIWAEEWEGNAAVLLSQLFSSISTISSIGNCMEGTFEYLVANHQRGIKIIYLQIEGRKIHVGSEVGKVSSKVFARNIHFSRKWMKTTRKYKVIMEPIWGHRSANEKYRLYNIRSNY